MKHHQLETQPAKIAQPTVSTDSLSRKEMASDHSPFLLVSGSMALLLAAVWMFFTSHKRALKSRLIDEIQHNKIPCQRCRFYNRDSTLRCAVHPLTVYTDQSVNCPDYHPTQTTQH